VRQSDFENNTHTVRHEIDGHARKSYSLDFDGNTILFPFPTPIPEETYVPRVKLEAAILPCWKTVPPMHPLLWGGPGNGKNTLFYGLCKSLGRCDELYIQHCSRDMDNPKLTVDIARIEDGKPIYRASPLLAAAVTGGICLLNEAEDLGDGAAEHLLLLLDAHRLLYSELLCTYFKAHPTFLLGATTNDPLLLPMKLRSRMKPVFHVQRPDPDEMWDIVMAGQPVDCTRKKLWAQALFAACDMQSLSARDAIQIVRYCESLYCSTMEGVNGGKPADTDASLPNDVMRETLSLFQAKPGRDEKAAAPKSDGQERSDAPRENKKKRNLH
jgi:hypothetical protein